MDKWNTDTIFRVAARAEFDELYQELLHECEIKEVAYQKILQTHSQIEQEQIEDYIAACEELEHRMTQLAYELGFADGARKRG